MGWTKTRSEIANTLRANPDADVTELRRDLKAQRLAEHVERAVATFPPLTDEQADRIAGILTGRSEPPRSVRRSSRVDDELREREP